MSAGARRVVGVLLLVVGGSGAFLGFVLAVLGWFTAPWIGSFGWLPWALLSAGAALSVGGLLTLRSAGRPTR